MIFVLFSGIVFSLVFKSIGEFYYQEALLLQASKKTPSYLKKQFRNERVRVLIVPGHDDSSVGTAFRGVKEADLNLILGELLFDFFEKDDRFNVFLVRDKNGYRKEFSEYFIKDRNNIIAFRDKFKGIMNLAFDVGILRRERKVIHNSVYGDTSIKLYGINKWANENDIDMVLHIHFNDYPGHGYNRAGKYTGFSIYVPEEQLPNNKASVDVAKAVLGKLKKYFAVSNYPPESEGIVEDQELIVLGANGSLDTPALLIEYGYIYESPLVSSSLRPLVLRDMALATYAGVNQYFNRKVISDSGYDTFLLPYSWENNMTNGLRSSKDVLSLQVALIQEKVYPPKGYSLSECPLTGNFGNCTKKASAEFQEKYKKEILSPLNLLAGTGFVGKSTLKKLNELYSK